MNQISMNSFSHIKCKKESPLFFIPSLLILMNLKLFFYTPYLKLFQTATMASKAPIPNYDRMTGGCTRVLATQMLSIISPPITSASYILDDACGTGIVSAEIKALHPDAKILATDLSPMMIEEVKQRIIYEGWNDVTTDTSDGRDLKCLPDETFTHIIANLGLPVPGDRRPVTWDREESLKVLREVFRVLKLGGVAMLSTWAGRSPFSHRIFMQHYNLYYYFYQTVCGSSHSMLRLALFGHKKPRRPAWP